MLILFVCDEKENERVFTEAAAKAGAMDRLTGLGGMAGQGHGSGTIVQVSHPLQ